ncbi:MAG: AMP-binding protein [Aquihabitans sp.]
MPDSSIQNLPSADGALVVDETRAWAPDEALDVADRLAHLIREATDGGRRRVGVFAENTAEAVLAHLGGLRSGASVVPINAHLAASEVAYVLETADVALVVSGPATASRALEATAMVPGCRAVSWADPTWSTWLATAPSDPPADDRPIQPSLLFTSGTTGTPKAVELPPNVFPRRPSWASFVEASQANRFVGKGRHLVVAPLHHTGPLNAVRALAAGTPVGIVDRFDPERILAAVHRWQIASTTLVPTHLARLAALSPEIRSRYDVSTMQLVFQTGASCPVPVKQAMIDWWGPVFLEAYGATEVGVTCAITSEDWLAHPGSVGRAVAPYEALVVDDDGQELPVGQEGRLCFRDRTGRGVIYHRDPERSAAAHVSAGVFTLGEIGRIDADGWVYVTDRFADMVVTGGANVYPAEMEQVLVAHPGVADVAGIGMADDDLGEILVALVVAEDPTSPPSRDDLQAWCEARLSRFKCPRRIRFVESLGRNALGKLDKRSLRAGVGQR